MDSAAHSGAEATRQKDRGLDDSNTKSKSADEVVAQQAEGEEAAEQAEEEVKRGEEVPPQAEDVPALVPTSDEDDGDDLHPWTSAGYPPHVFFSSMTEGEWRSMDCDDRIHTLEFHDRMEHEEKHGNMSEYVYLDSSSDESDDP